MQDLPEESIDRLQRVTRLLNTQRTLPAKLETVVALVKQTIPSCHAAGIMLLIAGEPTTAAVTDRLAVEIDLVQYDTGEGPCLAAIEEGKVIRIEIIERDSRFTRFAPGAIDRDTQSVLSIPLRTGDSVVGALNLYSHLPNAFDAATEEAVRPMAQYAADVIGTSPLYAFSLDMVDGLMETMESRALIERATGGPHGPGAGNGRRCAGKAARAGAGQRRAHEHRRPVGPRGASHRSSPSWRGAAAASGRPLSRGPARTERPRPQVGVHVRAHRVGGVLSAAACLYLCRRGSRTAEPARDAEDDGHQNR